MTYQDIYANDSVQLAQEVAKTVPFLFDYILVAIFLIFGIFNYQREERRGNNKERLSDSFAMSGFITSVIGALLLSIGLVSLTSVGICVAITILFTIISFFQE